MATTEFIAAIELSSSKISGIAGRRNSDGSIQVLAYATEEAAPFVRKGAVYNIGKAAQALTTIINRLEDQLKSPIAKVYAGIGGQSLRTVRNTVSHTSETGVISQELIDTLCDENLACPIVDMNILDVAPQEYKIDNNLYADPVGVTGKSVTGQFLNITAHAQLKKNLELSFEQAKIELADLLTAPTVLAQAVLTDNELRAGCALIDLGADTTTVMVYKNHILRYLSVIPLGGSNITRDITTLKMEEEEAEKLKLSYGDALYKEDDAAEVPASCTTEDGRSIPLAELNEIVGARTEEILANAWNQIQLSGYEDKLLAGIVLTGGTSNLRNIEGAMLKLCKMNKIRTADTVQETIRGYNEQIKKDGTQNTLLGLLIAGKENCCLQEKPQPTPPPDIFKDDEELKKQEEENRRKREEEEKRKKEEEKRKREEEKQKKEREKKSWFKSKIEDFTKELFDDTKM